MKLRVAALALVALALGWRLVAAAAGIVCEFTAADGHGRTLGRRLAAIDEPHAARRHRSLGFAEKIFDAVADHVPEDGRLLVVCAPSPQNRLFSLALFGALWPRRIEVIDEASMGDRPTVADRDGELFALTLGIERLPGPERWESLAGNLRFTLWRMKGPPR